MEFEKVISMAKRGEDRRVELMRELAELTALEAQWTELGERYAALLGEDGPEPSSTADILDAVERVLKGHAEAMSSTEILARIVEDEGVVVGGAAPAKNLSAKLSNAPDRFRSPGRGQGWLLAEADTADGNGLADALTGYGMRRRSAVKERVG